MRYADIIVDRSLEALDRIFQYVIPETLKDQLSIGAQVVVPFGKGNRPMKGYVIGFSDETDYDPEKLKQISEIVKDGIVVESQMIVLANELRDEHGCTMAQALKTVLNVKRQIRGGTKKVYTLAKSMEESQKELERIASQPRYGTRAAVLALLLDADPKQGLSESQIKKYYSVLLL